MFHIIQSNDTDTLVNHLIDFYKDLPNDGGLGRAIFEPFTVIVPSMVLGDWLTKQVALKIGISTLFTAQFWGKYQWQMTQTVLELDAYAHPHDSLAVPEVAVLSASIMRWRIFGFVSAHLTNMRAILENSEHPLHILIKPLYDDKTGVAEHRLWQACDELSRVYVRYLTHRPKWLSAWSNGISLADDVKKMMYDKVRLEREFGAIRPSQNDENDGDDETPEWLQEHYLALERLLGFLWHSLFAKTYLYRTALEERFWQVLSGARGDELAMQAKQALPNRLYLFTVQQIPQVELDFLKQLSQYLDVMLFHFNPSMMFWADIVDKNWLLTQHIIKPDSVYLKDYGHSLLSRLGKESRETFAMLADMTGGADDGNWVINWQDNFVRHYDKKSTLLNALKQDILMLGDGDVDTQSELGGQMLRLLQDETLSQKTRPKVGMPIQSDESLSIHVCHGLKRQLEILRLMIAKYLNDHPERTLSDVVVLLPDVESSQELILSVFPDGMGVDGLTLPIKITGTTDKKIDELLFAIMGFYELIGEPSSRFYAQDVYEWLQTPALYQAFGLSFDEIQRGCELLRQAGFRRGFDEYHLAQTLDNDDSDYRYTFSYALDRVVMGLISPNDGVPNDSLYPFVWQDGVFTEAVLPLAGVSLADEKVINALTAIHAGLHDNRNAYHQTDDVEKLLNDIEKNVIHRFFGAFHQTVAMRAIFNAQNAMKASLRANRHHHGNNQDEVKLSLKFVLNSLANDVKAQALSAEPADVITFARFGSLRSIPFGLTVMLDMNLSSFPRQDKAVRLDLMRAGVNQRGDRYNEDDDNGAFLDALLCTKDRALIFYHGVSPDGKTELLPASVVGELLQFFKTDALWQDVDDKNPIVHEISTLMPALIEHHLVTHHEPHAFDKQVFYHQKNDETPSVFFALKERIDGFKRYQKQHLPPPNIWRQVRHVLDESHDKVNTVSLLSDDEITAIQHALHAIISGDMATDDVITKIETRFGLADEPFFDGDIDELVFAITKPNRAFLKGKIAFTHLDETTLDEPLSLDGLDNYHIKQTILADTKAGEFDGEMWDSMSDTLHAMQYGDRLPAGVLRQTVLVQHLDDFGQKMTQFVANLTKIDDDRLRRVLTERLLNGHYSSYLTAIESTQVALTMANRHATISAKLPNPNQSLWLDFLPRTAKSAQIIRFWLYHLLWQTQSRDIKTSIWCFDKTSDESGFKSNTFILDGVSQDNAKRYLFGFILLYKIILKYPMVMTCRESLNHAKPDDKDFSLKKWLDVPNYGIIDDENAHHETWKFILKHQDQKDIILKTLVITDVLFKPMISHLKLG